MSSTDKKVHAAYPHWQRTKARQVSELLPDALTDVLARRSGMTLDLLAAWAEIAGPNYAHCTLPEKIAWPKRVSDNDPFKPGTLIVACDGPKALFFQHETQQVLGRINHFFGFQAVEKIKIVQKPVELKQKKEKREVELNAEKSAKLDDVLSRIDDPGLRQRLEKFGKGVYSRKNERRS